MARALYNIMIAETKERIDEQYEDYSHILRIFKAKDPVNAKIIGDCLGLKVFLAPGQYLYLNKNAQEKQFSRVCHLCYQINVPGLVLNFNFMPKLIESISFCAFPSLQVLNLTNNEIESVEQLCCIDSPLLTHLDLSFNKITNLQALRKASFPLLTEILIKNNRYQQIPELLLLPNLSFFEVDSRYRIQITKALTINKNLYINS